MATTQVSSARPRLAWPDVAKGVSILGVVLLHVSLAVPQGMETVAAGVNHILDPLRMPLFFLVSGFFSAKVFRFSLGELFVKRLWFFLVPYVIWVPIELWFKFREYQMFDGTPMPGIGTYLAHLLEARNMYWFLFALTVFNLFLWAIRRLPTWAGMLASFAPVLFLPLHSDYHMVGKAVLYLPVFIAGAYLRAQIAEHAESALSPRKFLPAAAAYLGGFALLAAWAIYADRSTPELPWLLPGADTVGYAELRLVVNTAVQLLMIPIAIAGAVALARIPYVSGALRFLGRHTLIIYLGHPIALTVLYHYNIRATDLEISRNADTLLGSTAFWLTIGMVISAIGSLVFWGITKIPGLRWSLMPPRLPIAVGADRRAPVDAAVSGVQLDAGARNYADRLRLGARPAVNRGLEPGSGDVTPEA